MVAHFVNNASLVLLARAEPGRDGRAGPWGNGCASGGRGLVVLGLGLQPFCSGPAGRDVLCSLLHQVFIAGMRDRLLEHGAAMTTGEEKQAVALLRRCDVLSDISSDAMQAIAAGRDHRYVPAPSGDLPARGSRPGGPLPGVGADQDLEGHPGRQGADARLPQRGRLLRRALPAGRRAPRGDGRSDGRVGHGRDRRASCSTGCSRSTAARPTSSRAR